MQWYFQAWKKYAKFNGRASRVEYWMFFLINLIVTYALAFIEGQLLRANIGYLGGLLFAYQLAAVVPSFAVAWRRMHDIDRSGWWNLVPIVSLVFLATKGTPGSNRFGTEPLATSRP